MTTSHRVHHKRSYLLLSYFTLATLCLLVTLAFASVPGAQAQPTEDESGENPSTIYAQLDYMQVPQDRIGEYLSIEREIWKPMHQERTNDGAIVGWQLYVVRYPGGTGHDYQYVTVTLFNDLDALENPQFETYAQRAHPDVDATVAMQRTTGARKLVRAELWVQHDQVASESATAPAPVLQVNYMKVPPGGESNYLSIEQDMIKPIHQARVDAGLMRGWSLWEMVFPSGTGQRHNYATADAFESMAAMPDSWPEGIVEDVHPGRSFDDIGQEVISARDLVHSELWELVDYVAPGSTMMSER